MSIGIGIGMTGPFCSPASLQSLTDPLLSQGMGVILIYETRTGF